MYEKMYHILFNALTDSLEQMEGVNYGIAVRILKKAQRETEEVYLGREDTDPLDILHTELTLNPHNTLPGF